MLCDMNKYMIKYKMNTIKPVDRLQMPQIKRLYCRLYCVRHVKQHVLVTIVVVTSISYCGSQGII